MLHSRAGYRNTGFVFILGEPVSRLEIEKSLEVVAARHVGILGHRAGDDLKTWVRCCDDWRHHIMLDKEEEEKEEEKRVPIEEACRETLERDVIGTRFERPACFFRMRVVRRRGFVIAFSHLLFDGKSRLLLARDFLRALKNLPLSEREEVPRERLPPNLFADILAVKEDVSAFPVSAYSGLPFDDVSPHLSQHRLAIRLRRISLAPLLARTRLHQTTLTMALATALVRVAVPRREGGVVVGLAYDLRAKCGLPQNELLNAGFPSGVLVEEGLPFWEATRRTATWLAKDMESMSAAKVVYGAYESELAKPFCIPNLAEVFIPFIISNLGPAQAGLEDLQCMFAAHGRGIGGSIAMHLHSMADGTCCLSYTFVTPLYDEHRVAKILDAAFEMILNEK